MLVDDASSPACAAVLGHLALDDNIFLIPLAVNQGKGGPVMAGLVTLRVLDVATWFFCS